MGQNDPDEDDSGYPLLAVGISLDEPSRRVAENAIACLTSIRDRGHPADKLITDMGYFGNQKAETFHLPARALGYGLVGDYKKGQAGLQATHKGVITVDGGRYCPSMPEPLVTATTDFREGRITEEVYRKRVAQRASHRFRPKDGVAHSCPAQGSGATAACPLRPESTGPTIGHRKALTVVLNPPADPPPCCTNRASVSLPHEYDAKYLQALPYGSPQWQRTYRLLRSTMEGYNGFAKDAKNASLAEPGHRRRRGFVNNLLVVAMTIAATNLRKIAAFRRAQAAPPTTGRPSPRRTTPRDPLAVHKPDPNAPPDTMPCAAVA